MSPHSACSLAHSFLSAMLSVLKSTGFSSQQGPPVDRILQSAVSSSQQGPPVNLSSPSAAQLCVHDETIMVDPSHSFYIADYAVFGVTIVISIGIGIYYALSGGRQRTTSEYLVGGRTMKFLPVAISLMVSFESSIMMLGLPAEMYVYGVQWWFSCLGYLVSQTLSAIVMVPLLHPLKITSAYEVSL